MNSQEFWASAEQDMEINPPTSRNGQIYIPAPTYQPRAMRQRNPWSANAARNEVPYYPNYPAISTSYPTYTYQDQYSSQNSSRMSNRTRKGLWNPQRNPIYRTYNRYNNNQRLTQNGYKQHQHNFKSRDTKLNERVQQQNSVKKKPQNIGPVPLWTPELYPDPETGEMNSVPGTAQVYSNGLTYPNTQIYVDTQVARNMPESRPLWDPNEAIAPTSTPQQRQSQPDLSNLEINPRFMDFTRTNFYYYPTQIHIPRHQENEYNWPLVYEIYGTSIGIILKCMFTELSKKAHNTTDLFGQDKWLQEQGLPYPATRWILDRYYYPQQFFHQVGERVQIGVHKRRELKDRIKVGLDSGLWPGDTDFSELRNSCEIIRRKALEFLEKWGDIFEKEWATLRQRRDWFYYYE